MTESPRLMDLEREELVQLVKAYMGNQRKLSEQYADLKAENKYLKRRVDQLNRHFDITVEARKRRPTFTSVPTSRERAHRKKKGEVEQNRRKQE